MRTSWSMGIRAVPAAAAIGAALLAAVPAGAQALRPGSNIHVPGSMGIPQPEPLITLNIQQRSLARVLYEMFKQTVHEYQLLADAGTQTYSLNVTKMPLTRVLNNLLSGDKRPDPLVFSYVKGLGNKGTFVIDREFIQVGREDGENRVGLANARITRVLPEIFKQMSVKGRIEPDVPPVTISLTVRPDEWPQALAMVMLEASKKEPGLTYSMDGEEYVVHLHRTPTGLGNTGGLPATAFRRVKVDFAAAPLKDALAEIFKDSKWKYQVADAVGDVSVTYSASAEPELAALVAVLKQASQLGKQLTYREGRGILYIEPGPLPGDFVVSSKGAVALRRSSLNQTQTKIKAVMALLAQTFGTTITVAPNVPDIPITFRFQNATVEEALQVVVGAARESLPNLSFRPRGMGYSVELGAN